MGIRSFLLGTPWYFPAILNFLLPGLGYLYLGNLPLCLIVFSVFLVLLLNPSLWGWLLILSIGVSLHLVLLRKESVISTRGRNFYFSAIGGTVFIFWVTLISPVWGVLKKQNLANAHAQEMATWVRECRKKINRLPNSAVECALIPGHGVPPKDPWGEHYLYQRHNERFYLRSKGVDGLSDTADDLTHSFR